MAYVGEPLGQHAQRRPNAPALTLEAETLTWAELERRVSGMAHSLSSYPSGSRLALAIRNPFRFLISYFAILRAGHVATVFDPDWPKERRQKIEAAIQPVVVLTEWISGGTRRGPNHSPSAHDPFYIGFTSGSTGLPKGFERTHASWLESFRVSETEFNISSSDHVLIAGSLQHSLHLYGAVHALHTGASVTLCSRFDPKTISGCLQSESISVLYATPTQLHYIYETLKRQEASVPLRLVLASGAKWRPEDRARLQQIFQNAKLAEFFGASETSFLTASSGVEASAANSVGFPVLGVELRIGDPLHPLPVGQSGLIWLRSPMVFSRYVCGESPDTRWKGEWLTVGDHGYIDEIGALFLTGRESRMIISSGLNIYPEEVERVLETQEGVAASAVFGVDDPVRGECLIAIIHPKGEALQAKQLAKACRDNLGRGFVPREFHFEDSWPLTSGGKTDLSKLKARYLARQSQKAGK